ncbi:hypothetical protein D3C76_900150 [compost metagenome]
MVQAQGDVGVFGGVGAGLVQVDLVEGQLLGALAGDVLEGDGGVVEVLLRQAVHVVTGGRGVQHIGLEHGVVGHAAHLDGRGAVGQDVDIVLGVLPDLGFGRVFQQGFERQQHGLAVQLDRGAFVVVGQRYIRRLMRLDRKRQADQLRLLGIEAGGFGVEREQRGLAQLVQPGIETGLVEHRLVLGFDLGRRRVLRHGHGRPGPGGFALNVGDPAFEFHLGVQGQQCITVWLAADQRLDFDIQRHVELDGGQLIGQERRLTVLFKLGRQGLGAADAQGRHLVEVVVDVAQAATNTCQQAGSGLLAHARHAGDVVDLVAHQGEEIDDVLRADTKLFVHPGNIHHATGHGVDQGDMPVHQLRHVLVAGRNDDRAALRRTAARQGADHIVGLHALDAQQRVAQGLDAGMQRFDLHPQVVRHARAVGLVLGEHGIAEGTALGVEHHRKQAVGVLLAQALEHVQHTLHRAGRHALGGGQRRQCVESAVEVGGTVHQDEGRLAHEQNQPFRRVRR